MAGINRGCGCKRHGAERGVHSKMQIADGKLRNGRMGRVDHGLTRTCGAVLMLLLLLVSGRCAQRMPPPSPDRFPPRLELARTRGRTGLELFFDEPVDLDRIPFDSLSIVGPDDEPLVVRGLAAGRGGDRLLVWTELQEPVIYRLYARVPDLAGNMARVRTRFRGGVSADTVPSRITSVRPGYGQTGHALDEIRFEFSKPMDTLVRPDFITIPAELETLLVPSWDPGWQRLTLRRPALRAGVEPPRHPEEDAEGSDTRSIREPERDSRNCRNSTPAARNDKGAAQDDEGADAFVGPPRYLVLLPGLSDLEGNRIRGFTATSYTPDTLFPGELIPGRIDGPTPALVVVYADTAIVLNVSDERGAFAVRVPAGSYEALALSDTAGDGRADFVGRARFVAPGPDTIIIQLEPEPEPRAIREYRR